MSQLLLTNGSEREGETEKDRGKFKLLEKDGTGKVVGERIVNDEEMP